MLNPDEPEQDFVIQKPANKIKVSLLIISIVVITTIIAENIYHYNFQNPFEWIRLVAPILLICFSMAVLMKSMSQVLRTSIFLVLCALCLALGSILGVVLYQQTTNLLQTGTTTVKIIHALQLDDVFHSWWYVSLYTLIGASLIGKSLLVKPRLTHGWIYLLYLSPVLIIIGFFLNSLWGWRGKLNLEIGEPAQKVQVYQGNTNKIKGHLDLPFQVKLNDVHIEQVSNEYTIQVVKNAQVVDPHGNSSENFLAGMDAEIIDEFPLELAKIRRVARTKVHFRLDQFFPNFGFQYDYPAQSDTIAPTDPGIMVLFITGSDKRQLQLRANQKNTLDDPHVEGTMEFYWEQPDDFLELSISSTERAFEDSLKRVIFIGSTEEVIFVYANSAQRIKLEKDKEYYFPGKRKIGFLYQFVFPDAKYITAVPGSINEELKNPVAKLEVWGKEWERAEYAYVYPPKGLGGYYAIPGTEYGLGLSNDSGKRFRSNVSVLDLEGMELQRMDIGENASLTHAGYRFIQKYDHSNKFPGLGVIFRRGMPLIYIGFAGLILAFLRLILGQLFLKE